MSDLIPVLPVTELPSHKPTGFELEGQSLVIVPHQGKFQVFDGKCPHQGTFLSEGWLEDGKLVCRTHQWRFDCGSGKKQGKPLACLQKIACQVQEETLYLERPSFEAFKNQTQDIPTQAVRSLDDLPGPKTLPILGNVHQFRGALFHQTIENWAKEHGDLFKLMVGGKRLIVSTNPELNLQILKNRPHGFSRSSRIQGIFKDLGLIGVFNAEGEQWRRHRQFVMQALAHKNLKQFYPVVSMVSQRLRKRWKKASQENQAIDVQKDLMRLTVDATTNLAFGYDMNTLEEKSDQIQEHLEKVFPTLNRRLYSPFPYWRYFKLPIDKQTDRAMAAIKKKIDEILEETREIIKQQPELKENPRNFLEALLVARDEEGSTFDDNEIYSNVFTMLVAGEDTTANTISWMMYYCTQYPEVQKKLQAEVDAVLGKEDILEDHNRARELRYLDALAQETMRFKPVAPVNGVTALQDMTLNQVFIPKDTSLLLISRPGGFKESAYPDAYAFKPGRWLDPDFRKQDRYNIPFGSGPRLCPGRGLAMMEIYATMAMIARNFDLSLAPQEKEVQEHLAFTMMPQHLFIRLKERVLSDAAPSQA